MLILTLSLLAWVAGLASATQDWRMLDQYPAHYVTHKLAAGEAIIIDGKLDDPAWAEAEWTYDMVDITRHKDQQLNAIPNDLQARVKIRWDDNYFYIGAVLHESYVSAQVRTAPPAPGAHQQCQEAPGAARRTGHAGAAGARTGERKRAGQDMVQRGRTGQGGRSLYKATPPQSAIDRGAPAGGCRWLTLLGPYVRMSGTTTMHRTVRTTTLRSSSTSPAPPSITWNTRCLR